MSYILILGAKSDIAKAIARTYAKHGYNIYLAARNNHELNTFAQDLSLRSNQDITLVELDILDYKSHKKFYNNLREKPVGVISAIGYLGNQKEAESNFNETHLIIDTNYTGVISLFEIIAHDFEKRKSGFIVGISSVAGDRGRKSNYIYGSAKAAFSTYLSGLRNRLYETNIHVMTVKPGFVATKMTENIDLPKILTGQPEEIANDIYTSQQAKKNILYTKWIWRWIMLIIRNIPEFQFKKMSI